MSHAISAFAILLSGRIVWDAAVRRGKIEAVVIAASGGLSSELAIIAIVVAHAQTATNAAT